MALLDIYLGGYVAQLTSLQQRPLGAQQERYNSLEMEYSQRRSELLAPLREFNGARGARWVKISGWHSKKQRRLAEQQSCLYLYVHVLTPTYTGYDFSRRSRALHTNTRSQATKNTSK